MPGMQPFFMMMLAGRMLIHNLQGEAIISCTVLFQPDGCRTFNGRPVGKQEPGTADSVNSNDPRFFNKYPGILNERVMGTGPFINFKIVAELTVDDNPLISAAEISVTSNGDKVQRVGVNHEIHVNVGNFIPFILFVARAQQQSCHQYGGDHQHFFHFSRIRILK